MKSQQQAGAPALRARQAIMGALPTCPRERDAPFSLVCAVLTARILLEQRRRLWGVRVISGPFARGQHCLAVDRRVGQTTWTTSYLGRGCR